jgi:hypothetical protein
MRQRETKLRGNTATTLLSKKFFSCVGIQLRFMLEGQNRLTVFENKKLTRISEPETEEIKTDNER